LPGSNKHSLYCTLKIPRLSLRIQARHQWYLHIPTACNCMCCRGKDDRQKHDKWQKKS